MRRKPGRLITIGSFDGVHRGHAALLNYTVSEAKKRHLKSLALTFAIPPRMILNPHPHIFILSDPIEKEILIRSHGIDEVVNLDFNRNFSTIKPYRFFREILINKFKAKGLVVGLDFRFGENRSGGAVDLVRWGQEERIPVWVIPQIKIKGLTISSTEIRSLLMAHAFRKAIQFLGHPYTIHGKIVRGRGMGRRIGFPTSNLQPSLGKVIPQGVFVVRATRLMRGQTEALEGVCNIGRRPTFLKASKLVIEPHWFNHKSPKVGEHLILELLHYVRPEKKFKSVVQLQSAIRRDVNLAKRYFRFDQKTVPNIDPIESFTHRR